MREAAGTRGRGGTAGDGPDGGAARGNGRAGGNDSRGASQEAGGGRADSLDGVGTVAVRGTAGGESSARDGRSGLSCNLGGGGLGTLAIAIAVALSIVALVVVTLSVGTSLAVVVTSSGGVLLRSLVFGFLLCKEIEAGSWYLPQ